MIINSKFNTGNRVWVVQEINKAINIYSDTIEEISVVYTNKGNKIKYWLKNSCESFDEKEIIDYEDEEKLISMIKDLDNKIIIEELVEGD